ncbi:MAG TPA: J domain-containing protein [Candidatus Nitrosotalea sp.]|nr:J domain-containing protein [Candidatus Nitrosotalea sp.]
MAVNSDYYAALGVTPKATKKEIHGAFRNLARRYHPDLNQGDKEAERRFKEVSEAHDVLSDPEKRKLYDAYGADWQAASQAGAAAPPGGRRRAPAGAHRRSQVEVDPERLRDIFGADMGADLGSIFGFSGAGRRSRPAVNQADIEVTLREAYLGASRQVALPDGRTIEIKVPPGVADGTVLRAPGLQARVRILADPEFEREGANLKTVVSVPLAVAMLGGKVEVPTPRGGRVELTIPAQTQNGARLRLRGLGMPGPRAGVAGDLHVEVKVRLPLPLDEATRAWLESMPEPA